MSDDVEPGAAAEARQAAATVVALAARVRTLQAQVASGDLVVDAEVGEEIRNMLSEQMDQVDIWSKRAADLARRAALGQNAVAEVASDRFQQLAGEGETALAGVLGPYRELLEQAHDTVGDAMRRYAGLEDQVVELLHTAAGDNAPGDNTPANNTEASS